MGEEHTAEDATLRQLRRTLELVQGGHTAQALEVLERTLAAREAAAPGVPPWPEGVLPWLQLARAGLRGHDRAVPPFLALQTALVLLEV